MRFFFLLLFLFPIISQAEIYRYINENGEVVYSDKPVEGAKKQAVSRPPTMPALKTTTDSPNTDSSTSSQNEFVGYSTLAISQPENDTQVRNNVGTVDLVLRVEPALFSALGHRFAVELDGKRLSDVWSTPNIALANIDRGTHTVKVIILDESKKSLIESKVVTFHLFRHSQLF